MAKQQALNFLQKIKEDENFKAKIQETQNSDQFIELAKSEGYDITLDDLENVIKENLNDELSDKDLESVAGGGFFGTLANWARTLTTLLKSLDEMKIDIKIDANIPIK